MAAGPNWASSLQILIFLFITAVLIRERIGDDFPESYQATSVSKMLVAPEFVSNSTNHGRFKSRAKRFTSRRVLYTAKGTSSFNLERTCFCAGMWPQILARKGRSGCLNTHAVNVTRPLVITKTPSCVLHVETGHTLNASICLGTFSSTT